MKIQQLVEMLGRRHVAVDLRLADIDRRLDEVARQVAALTAGHDLHDKDHDRHLKPRGKP